MSPSPKEQSSEASHKGLCRPRPLNYGPLGPQIPPVCTVCYLTFYQAVSVFPRTQATALTSVDVYVEKVDNPHCSDTLIEASKSRVRFRILIADRFIMVCEPGVCLAALLFRTKCEVKEYIVSGMRFLNPRIVSFLNGGVGEKCGFLTMMQENIHSTYNRRKRQSGSEKKLWSWV